jgi:heme-degrading monooxygenase HmoA
MAVAAVAHANRVERENWGLTMAILREWRGEIRRSERDAYVAYIRGTGIVDYRKTAGNLGAVIAVNDLDDERSEVVTLSLWESWDAIRAFAGDQPELARYYPEDDRYLLKRPLNVKHYDAFGELLLPPAT